MLYLDTGTSALTLNFDYCILKGTTGGGFAGIRDTPYYGQQPITVNMRNCAILGDYYAYYEEDPVTGKTSDQRHFTFTNCDLINHRGTYFIVDLYDNTPLTQMTVAFKDCNFFCTASTGANGILNRVNNTGIVDKVTADYCNVYLQTPNGGANKYLNMTVTNDITNDVTFGEIIGYNDVDAGDLRYSNTVLLTASSTGKQVGSNRDFRTITDDVIIEPTPVNQARNWSMYQ